MRSLATTVAGLAALGALAGGCGGDDDGDGAASASDVLACIEDAGLSTEEQPEDETIGLTQAIFVEVPGEQNRVIVNFFEDSESASSYQEGQGAFLGGAGAGGSSEVVGETTVVGVARSGAEDEFETVKACAEG